MNIGVFELEQKLMSRNKKLIDMIIERAKRDFPEDIALIGLTGSFATGDFHEKSDLDLFIVMNNDKAWEASECFILGDIGYDFYCTSWEQLEQMTTLESLHVDKLTDSQILYSPKPEYLEKYNTLKELLLNNLAKPVGVECIGRARKHIDIAKQYYADMILSDSVGLVRFASGCLVYSLAYSILHLNNSCVRRGTNKFFEEIASCRYLPENFENLYIAVIEAKTTDEIRNSSHLFLTGVIQLYENLHEKYIKQPTPSHEDIEGVYEECWSNYGNKIVSVMTEEDKPYAFLVATATQSYFNEMTVHNGMKKVDVIKSFDADNLKGFKNVFLEVLSEYHLEYDRVGRKVLKFETVEELYNYYMEKNNS